MKIYHTMIKWLLLILPFAFIVKYFQPQETRTEQQPYSKVIEYIAKKYNKDERVIKEYVNITINEANKYSIDPLLILAMIETESNFNTLAYNPSGAQGLMQVIPKYHVVMSPYQQSLYDPYMGIGIGVGVLYKFILKHNGNFKDAINNYGGDSRGNYYKKVMKNLKQIEEYDI